MNIVIEKPKILTLKYSDDENQELSFFCENHKLRFGSVVVGSEAASQTRMTDNEEYEKCYL